MNKFLEFSHKALGCLVKYEKIHIVLGNESCDLDSAISSLVYAYYLYKKFFCSCTKTIVLPILNINDDELQLKTETKYFLAKNNVSLINLIFRNQVDFGAHTEKLVVTLVDHHLLSEKDKLFENCIKEVIDHRPIDPKFNYVLENKVIDEVGSCCTLVANIILNSKKDIMTKELAILLHGTIILDTVNFNKDAKRFKNLDLEIVDKLEKMFGLDENRENIHAELTKARSDISTLTAFQILQKDMKIVNNIPVPGVPMLFAEFINLKDSVTALKELCSKCNSKILIPMGLATKNGQVYRDIAIFFIENNNLKEKLFNVLCNNKDLDLEIIQTDIEGLILFKQKNIKMSRKHIIPIIKNVFE